MDQPLPVICDLCRAHGLTGEAPFADLADLLSFTPVPRRPHANGWTPEMQRGFIAALVATGAPPRAARAIGKHAFGAEQLRRARGGQSFAAAWDAALELARERELAGLREGLTELAAEQEQERLRRRSAILPAADRHPPERHPAPPPEPSSPRLNARERHRIEAEQDAADRFDEVAEAKDRIRARLTNARRLLLKLIAPDPARRAAWEALVGPVDWARAERGEGQDDEPFHDSPPGTADPAAHNFTKADMLLTAEAGLLSEFTGGPDPLEPLRRAIDPAPDHADLPAEQQAAIAAYRDALKANGWEEDAEGNLWSPEPPSAAE